MEQNAKRLAGTQIERETPHLADIALMATRAQIVMQQESVQRSFTWSGAIDMNGLVLGRAK